MAEGFKEIFGENAVVFSCSKVIKNNTEHLKEVMKRQEMRNGYAALIADTNFSRKLLTKVVFSLRQNAAHAKECSCYG